MSYIPAEPGQPPPSSAFVGACGPEGHPALAAHVSSWLWPEILGIREILHDLCIYVHVNVHIFLHICISTPPNVPLLRALRSLLDGIWGSLKGSCGVLVYPYISIHTCLYMYT